MELYKFHIVNNTLGSIYHCNSISCGNQRIGGSMIEITNTPRGNQRNARQELMNDPAFQLKHIGTIAFNIGQVPLNQFAQMVLGDNFNGEKILEHVNIWMVVYSGT